MNITADAETILLVEASALVRSEVAEFLRGCGYRVVEAANAAEALDILENRHVDVMVTDLELREGSGFELSGLAKRHRPNIRVILTRSAERTAKAAESLCDEGPLDYPYHPQQLVKRIKRLRRR